MSQYKDNRVSIILQFFEVFFVNFFFFFKLKQKLEENILFYVAYHWHNFGAERRPNATPIFFLPKNSFFFGGEGGLPT